MKEIINFEYDERALPKASDIEENADLEEIYETNEENTDGEDTDEGEEKISDDYYELPKARSSRNMIWSVVSVVLAVLSIPAAGIYWLGITFAILSVGAGLFSRYRLGYFDKWSVFGLIFGIMGAVCGIFSMIVSLSGIFN